MTANRTLLGAKPPRGQELSDHYFGPRHDRVLAYTLETERELYRLGIPIKTRHNGVAPGQFEIVPIVEKCNIAADNQQLIMITLKRIAKKYGFECILHEKPFDGVNGSGKHLNWSLTTREWVNLLDPDQNRDEHMQFLFLLTAVRRVVSRYQDLMRIYIAIAGNDHRLGAHEGPAAINSVYIAEQLADIIPQLLNGGLKSSNKSGILGLG